MIRKPVFLFWASAFLLSAAPEGVPAEAALTSAIQAEIEGDEDKAKESRKQPVRSESERNRVTEETLDSVEIDFPFGDGRPFKEVLGELSVQTGLRFVLDQSAEDMDLTQVTPIEFSAESLRLRTGLEILLGKYNASYVIRDGAVWIISSDATLDPGFFRRKIFDVDHLLHLIVVSHDIKDRPRILPPDGLVSRRSKPGTMGGGFFSLPGQLGSSPLSDTDSTQQVSPMTPHRQLADSSVGAESPELPAAISVTVTAKVLAGELLVDLIRSQVVAQSWAESGHGDGVVEIVGGALVVHQSENALQQVGELLRELETRLEAIDSRARNE